MTARKIRLVKGDDNTCPKCGSADIVSRTYADTVDFRDLELNVEGLRDSKCRHCEHVWATRDQTTHNSALVRDAYAAERDRLRADQGLLLGPDIARIREELRLNQREAASLFGGGYNAFNKYESGEVLQSFAMDRLLRLSAAIGKPAVEFLRDVYSPLPFVVISISSTYSTSVPHSFFKAVSPLYETGFLLRSTQTHTDAAKEAMFFSVPPRGHAIVKEIAA